MATAYEKVQLARGKAMLETELDALCEKDGDTLLKERYARFRKY